jgi:membrane protein
MEDSTMATSQRRVLALGQTLLLSVFRLHRARGGLHARALTSITLLSLVPFLAFVFAVAKSFGVYHRLKTQVIHPTLDQWLNGAEAPDLRAAVDQIFQFVQDTNLHSLGLLGLLITAFAAIRMLTAVEHAFNDLWDVRRPRNLLQKVIQYLLVLVVVPGVVLLATAASTAVRNHGLVDLLHANSTLGPVAVQGIALCTVWAAFAFLYASLPNVHVPRSAAILGGLTGGTLWMMSHYVHLQFQLGVAETNALYASFSVFPVFLLWIFVSWITVLAGGAVAAAHQLRQAHRDKVIQKHLGTDECELHVVALCMSLIASPPEGPQGRPLAELFREIEVSNAAGEVAIRALEDAKIVRRTQTDLVSLRAPPDLLLLSHVLSSCRTDGAPMRHRPDALWLKQASEAITAVRTVAAAHPDNASLALLASRAGEEVELD